MLTIGLVQTIVNESLVKFGKVIEKIDYQLRSSAEAFDSHSLAKIKSACIKQFGFDPL